MAVGQVKSSRPNRIIARDLAGSVLRRCAVIKNALIKARQYLFRSIDFASDVNDANSGARQLVSACDAKAKAAANTESRASCADAPDLVTRRTLDEQEVQRRRNLVRMLFNGYWAGIQEKPAAFNERLDQAEEYLNERLAAHGEVWRLDATTRAILGLPPRSSGHARI